MGNGNDFKGGSPWGSPPGGGNGSGRGGQRPPNIDEVIEKIQKLIKGEKCDLESSNLSKREWNELMQSFGFKEKIV